MNFFATKNNNNKYLRENSGKSSSTANVTVALGVTTRHSHVKSMQGLCGHGEREEPGSQREPAKGHSRPGAGLRGREELRPNRAVERDGEAESHCREQEPRSRAPQSRGKPRAADLRRHLEPRPDEAAGLGAHAIVLIEQYVASPFQRTRIPIGRHHFPASNLCLQ